MIKLPAALRRDTASKLEAARTELETAELTLADLEAKRVAALGDDDMEVVARWDEDVARQQRVIAAHRDRIPILEQKLASEQEAQRERDREATLVAVKALMPKRYEAALQVEAALRTLAAAALKFRAATVEVQETYYRQPDLMPSAPLPYGAEDVGYIIQIWLEPDHVSYVRTLNRVEPVEYFNNLVRRDYAFADWVKGRDEEKIAGILEALHPPPPEPEDVEVVEPQEDEEAA